jgi:hypothetical protein
MDRVAEITEAVEADTLTDEELAAARDELTAMFEAVRAGEIEGVDAADVAALSQIVELVDTLGAAAAVRMEAAAEAAAAIAELEARLTPAVPVEQVDEEDVEIVAEDDTDAEVEVEVTDADVAEVIAEAEAVVEAEAVEPVAAAAVPLATIAKSVPAKTRPRKAEPMKSHRIYGQNGEIADLAGVAKAMSDAWNSGVASPYGNRVRVARIAAEYPSDRVLPEMDGTTVDERIEAVVAAGQNPSSWSDAVVASGGWCAPTDVDYGLVQISEASRPVRDALPAFQATRGGLRVAGSPTLADVTVAYDADDEDAAISVWDNATDLDPDGATKGVQVIPCPEFDEYLTQAIVKRLRAGNFGARAFPEKVSQFNELALAAHARVGDTILLDGIKGASTAVTVGQSLGAARDLIEAIKRAAAAYRSRHRSPNVVLRAMVPRWITTLGDVDLVRSLASDSRFVSEGEAVFVAGLAVAGVNVTFYDDSPTTGVSQVFGAQSAGALTPFPTAVQWGLYDEGHFLFLDGGTLDLGIVRDSNLNSTNDYETFVETFEGLAPRGVESLWITSTVCPDGTSAAALEDAVSCGS